MRNIGEHLPEYLLGSGRLRQRPDLLAQRSQINQLGVMIWTGHDENGTRLTWAGTNIDANEARRAADQLYLAVRDAIDRFAVGATSTTLPEGSQGGNMRPRTNRTDFGHAWPSRLPHPPPGDEKL